MKTKTTAALVLALGVLSTGAFAENTTVVFSELPSPAFYYDANAPAHWYLSVSFHFDWGRNRGG